MPTKNLPTIEYLRQCFHYDSGRLFWLKRLREHFSTADYWRGWNNRWSGKEAGYLDSGRRWQVRVNDRKIPRYYIVWALHFGEWPELLDHRNRDSSNDRINNLRLVTPCQNAQNRRRQSNNKAGLKGVSWDRGKGRWRATITVNRRWIQLGLFDTPELAHHAYIEAIRLHFGEFACEG
jgi:hypothetical protein